MKKEEKETIKDYSLEEKDQRRLKGLTKFLYIVAKIVKVFAIIGIVGVCIAMIAVPIITSNTKTEKQGEQSIVKVFDKEIYYNRSDSKIEMYEKDKIDDIVEVKKQDEVEALNKVFDYLEKNDFTKINVFAEIEFALLIVTLVIEIMIINKVYKFFKNIHDEKTPFIKENIELLENIAKFSIIGICVAFVMSLVSSIMINLPTTFMTINIIDLLLVFVFIYIFKYGYKLQNETKGKIYKEE